MNRLVRQRSGRAPGLVLVRSVDFQSATTIDFDELPPEYTSYRLVLNGVTMTVSGAYVAMVFSADGGSTFDVGANYSRGVYRFRNNGSNLYNVSGNAVNDLLLLRPDTDALWSGSGEFTINMAPGVYANVHGMAFNRTVDVGATQPEGFLVGGTWRSTAGRHNAFRLSCAGGGTMTGSARLYAWSQDETTSRRPGLHFLGERRLAGLTSAAFRLPDAYDEFKLLVRGCRWSTYQGVSLQFAFDGGAGGAALCSEAYWTYTGGAATGAFGNDAVGGGMMITVSDPDNLFTGSGDVTVFRNSRGLYTAAICNSTGHDTNRAATESQGYA